MAENTSLKKGTLLSREMSDVLPIRSEILKSKYVEEAVDIGNGYIVIKINDLGRSAAMSLPSTDEGGEYLPMMSMTRLKLSAHRSYVLARNVMQNRSVKSESGEREQIKSLTLLDIWANLVESGLLITAKELGLRLGISEPAISKARKEGRLFHLETSRGRRMYPAFYGDPEASRADLESITRILGNIPPTGKWEFFTTPISSLDGRTPVQALKEGNFQGVIAAAAHLAER